MLVHFQKMWVIYKREYIDGNLNGELGIVIKGVGIRVVFLRPKLACNYSYDSLVIIR